MLTRSRDEVRISGDGAATMVFAHGFGCDQTMWLTFDLVGSGGSDLAWTATILAPDTSPGPRR